jgi:glycosyltransferase involved in cell wall biosynthesis
LPSLRNETWGLAINEAMACQRPVIASTKVGCTPDLVIDSTTGWKFEQGERSSEKVAAIIMSLLQNRTVLTKMGKMAYARIQYYSYEAITTATFDLIEKIA